MKFIDLVLKYAKPKGKVLDLGAGQGKQAEQFLLAGFNVTAVDKDLPENINSKIDWHKAKIEEFLKDSNQKYDVIFARNIFQFLDKEYITNDVPKILKNILKPGGVIAVRTFYKDSEPSLDKYFASYYSLDELKDIFYDFEILYEYVWDEDRPDLRGQVRRFHVSEIIVRIK